MKAPAMPRNAGFTLIEMLIVVAVIAIIAVIAIPNLLSSRLITNEQAAVVTLRHLLQSQQFFVTARAADVNRNGVPEFGTFGEMSGKLAVRAAQGGTKVLDPTMASHGFRNVNAMGEIVRSGYVFRVYLPDAIGQGLGEDPGGGAPGAVDATQAEGLWCALAWPVTFNATGRRTYFVNQSGSIVFTEDPNYSGPGSPVWPGAALTGPGGAISITGTVAFNAPGRDGNVWKPEQD